MDQGFNTISVADMANETLFVFILLMFTGAGPGSCGGGIITSTLTSLTLLGVSRFRGPQRPQVFHRTVSEASMTKALSEARQRILYKIGVSEVFFTEKDLAISLAERLHNPNMLDYLPFPEGYSIIQLLPPRQFIGKALCDPNLINRYGVQIVAVKEKVPDRLNLIPETHCVIKESDILIILGPNESLDKLKEKES